MYLQSTILKGAWASIVVKALRYKSEGPGGVAGIFPVTSDRSMCPGADSASKIEYQYISGVKATGA